MPVITRRLSLKFKLITLRHIFPGALYITQSKRLMSCELTVWGCVHGKYLRKIYSTTQQTVALISEFNQLFPAPLTSTFIMSHWLLFVFVFRKLFYIQIGDIQIMTCVHKTCDMLTFSYVLVQMRSTWCFSEPLHICRHMCVNIYYKRILYVCLNYCTPMTQTADALYNRWC